MNLRQFRVLAVSGASGLVLAGCGNTSEPDNAASEGLSVVASTNVYGDIAEAIAGDRASVNSIVTSANQDPHEYEASAQDQLAITDADVVVKNGGGFDSFVDTLLDASNGDPVVLDAVEISGLSPEDGEDTDEHADGEAGEHAEEGHDHVEGFNEHVWYDFESVEHVAEEIAHEMGELDPDNAAFYEKNLDQFIAQVENLKEEAAELKVGVEGQGVAITEPVPVYLLEAVGLVNKTPDAFSEAVEEGADVPASVLSETLALFTTSEVSVLAYNEQTVDSVTEQVSAAAEDAGVPVVSFTETLPEGQGYVEWMTGNLAHLEEALG